MYAVAAPLQKHKPMRLPWRDTGTMDILVMQQLDNSLLIFQFPKYLLVLNAGAKKSKYNAIYDLADFDSME